MLMLNALLIWLISLFSCRMLTRQTVYHPPRGFLFPLLLFFHFFFATEACWQAAARSLTLPSQYVTARPGAFKQVHPHTNKQTHLLPFIPSSYLSAACRPTYPYCFWTDSFYISEVIVCKQQFKFFVSLPAVLLEPFQFVCCISVLSKVRLFFSDKWSDFCERATFHWMDVMY